jgi:pantetheine-phosphate adenylyltransferase
MKYKVVATGGTFDHLHSGHVALLEKSFKSGRRVLIGVTSDAFAAKEGKSPDDSFSVRVKKLEELIHRKFPGREYTIAKLDDYFGPGIASPDVEAIVVSKETISRVPLANVLRAQRGYPPLEVVKIDFILAEDDKPISSTRIRHREIDERGRLLRVGERKETSRVSKGI